MQKCADPFYHQEDRKYKKHKETTKTTTIIEPNKRKLRTNKQTQERCATFNNQFQKMNQSRRKKKQKQKPSNLKAHGRLELHKLHSIADIDDGSKKKT